MPQPVPRLVHALAAVARPDAPVGREIRDIGEALVEPVRRDFLVQHAVGFDGAELLRKVDVLLRREILFREHEHRVLPESGLDCGLVLGSQRPGEVHAAVFSGEGLGDGTDFHTTSS
jgi:hypothetical protein